MRHLSIRHPSGHVREAERLAREAATLADSTQWLDCQAATTLALADVLRLSGQTDEARKGYDRAIELYAAKGKVVMAERAKRLARNCV